MLAPDKKKDDPSRSALLLLFFLSILHSSAGIGCHEHQQKFRIEMGGGMSSAQESHHHLHYRHPFKKVFVTGAAKEAKKFLTSIVGNSYLVASLFPSYSIIMYVDDDENLEVLSDWSSVDNSVTIIKGDYSSVQIHPNPEGFPFGASGRTDRLAHARNTLVSEVRNQVEKVKLEAKEVIMVMIDLDDRTEHVLDTGELKVMLRQFPLWDVLSFNRPEYYDTWALRYLENPMNAYSFKLFKDGRQHDKVPEVKQAISTDLGKIIQTLEPPLLPVASAFNSIALYKLNHTTDCNYSGWDSTDKPEGWPECEHVPFHTCMVKTHNTRVRIDPFFAFRGLKWDECAASGKELWEGMRPINTKGGFLCSNSSNKQHPQFKDCSKEQKFLLRG
ncbi:hypothetical protein CEUSTIGMA_g8580.t1 [Chlamydomonas eustigma]|uniref:Nucleotide-diphospho-sugar transferase domain-containing protein n=1 Tax=Chlamydomonas eustigma TaxID=1157962 RepID=A0A250XDI3_9CHLO|nr:hypothetical protein CEUSTIGMA_g8580.t1 [Chlamydomonas eustigma]|eukprot:GAX81147.1 hypothetical protein CEUSTIGMA_g8580.t1 [Chlamydomonas eustigma]